MTRAAGTVRIVHDGNDVATSFSVPYVFWDEEDLKVTHVDSGGTETLLVLDTDYTVTGGEGGTGAVIYPKVVEPPDDPLATGESLAVVLNLPIGRDTDMEGTYQFDTENLAGDKAAAMMQQLQTILARASTLRETSTDTPPDLETILAGIPGSGFALQVSLGFHIDGGGQAIVAGIKNAKQRSSRNGTFTKVIIDSSVNGADSAKTGKFKLYQDGVPVSDELFLNNASSVTITDLSGWPDTSYSARKPLRLELLSSPAPTIEYASVYFELDLV